MLRGLLQLLNLTLLADLGFGLDLGDSTLSFV